MTPSTPGTTARHAVLAAMRGDRSRRKAPGMTMPARQAEQPESGRRRWAVLAVVSAAQFLIVLDLWVVNIALPALQHDFAPATLPDVSWILDVYAIVLATLLLPAGRAADSIGRRKCFLAGLVVFGIASLGCALAPGLPALVGGRALQAAGAAVLMPTTLGLARSVFPAWSAPESLEAAMVANHLRVYQMPMLYSRFPHTFSVAYPRSMSEAAPRYTTAPSPPWRSSHHPALASLRGSR
jgi:hypothetical protein